MKGVWHLIEVDLEHTIEDFVADIIESFELRLAFEAWADLREASRS